MAWKDNDKKHQNKYTKKKKQLVNYADHQAVKLRLTERRNQLRQEDLFSTEIFLTIFIVCNNHGSRDSARHLDLGARYDLNDHGNVIVEMT
ncbi:hypothetical protein T11_10729 [Trichinella zimbabwensis]|uniref:Uncharacterized protein n=1 Tax=Trichinella zimbabwensis TaxID=268475 RepID=A0A0V1HAP9_9BILA|nr:hypothetical protein T11_10729 [Trichinella zimbabwensis]